MSRLVVIVPPVPALLSAYSSCVDPLPELREAVAVAVGRLANECPNRIAVVGETSVPADVNHGVATSLSRRLAEELLDRAGFSGTLVSTLEGTDPETGVLVLANGSACRGEKAPGYLDGRAVGYDSHVQQALESGDLAALRSLDVELGTELQASGLSALTALATSVGDVVSVDSLYVDDPFGVQYWVVTWVCQS